MKVGAYERALARDLAARHPAGCVCVSCEATREVAAFERLLESLNGAERDKPAGVVLSQAICDARERMGKHA